MVDVVKEFESFGVQVDVIDPHADSEELRLEYGFGLVAELGHDYAAVIVAVNHDDFIGLPESHFKNLMNPKGIFVDLKGIYKGKIKDLQYWSL